MKNKPFSVLMSVYKNDDPFNFRIAVESVTINQTVKPDEVYIYVDGPVPENLAKTIRELESEIPTINVHWEIKNKGLGKALQYGIEHVKNELVARMDSDDISVPDRFECQLRQFDEDPDLSVASGHTIDFIDSPKNVLGKRVVPIGSDLCMQYIKKRDVFNHPAVMYKKSEVLKAGNYKDWYLNEDSYLWLRMYLAGCKFDNLNKVLVYMRSGKDQYLRRGGWKYFKSEAGLQYLRYKYGIIKLPQYIFNLLIHFVVKVLMPSKLRGLFYQKFLRVKSN